MKAGVIGLGDMGSGLAKNLIANGFETSGFDLSDARMAQFAEIGGVTCTAVGEVGGHADIVYVMVMNGDQAKDVILGEGGLATAMGDGGIIMLTATIKPAEARAIGDGLAGTGIRMIDSPVSGGFPGAQGGTLTMMAAAPDDLLEAARPAMEAVSATIHHVGRNVGDGQVMKACLQSIIGSIFSVIFSNSPSTLSVTWSHIGGILSSSTVPGSFSFFTMLPFSSSYSLSLSEDEYSLLLPSSLSPRHRTFRRVKSGGCDRLRFSHRSNIRTATRNDTRPYLACAPGVHSNHTDGLGGAQFLGTKNSRPSVPCRSSGWS